VGLRRDERLGRRRLQRGIHARVGQRHDVRPASREFTPGDGFLVGRSELGELDISAYVLVRWVDQTPATQTFTDHLGNVRTTDARDDIWPHRAMVFFKGWVGNPKLVYNIILWTVNDTDQDAVFGNVGYQFSKHSVCTAV
jgi:hypothetical protein